MLFQKTPLKRRLMLVILLTSVTVLVLTATAFVVYELIASRRELRRTTYTAAQIIATQVTAPLIIQNEKVATEILASLAAADHVVVAALYDTNATLLAYYPTNLPLAKLPPHLPKLRVEFTIDRFIWCQAVLQNGKQVGTLFLESTLAPVYDRLRAYGFVGVIVLLGSITVAFLLSRSLQEGISKPILELADTARRVSEARNYQLRARKVSDDEIGFLTDAFNQMLGHIQDRDSALQETADRLGLALQASQIGTWDWHLQSNKVNCDEFIHRQFGVPPGAGPTTFEWYLRRIHSDDRETVVALVRKSTEQRKEFHVEFRVVWPDHSVHFLAARGKGVYDERGTVVRMTGVSLDISERRKAEETHALLASIVESSDDAIIGKNLEGDIISWNAGAERMFRYTASEIIGRSVTLLTAADRPDEEGGILRRIRSGSRVEHYETVRMRRDGTAIQVALSVSPIRNGQGQIVGVSSIARDITDRKRAEDEIRRLNADLERRVRERTAELMAINRELEAFTYSVSHDLRAPLRHIDAFARILEEELPDTLTPELRDYVDRIRRGTQTMGRLVDDLLNLSRVGRAELGWRSVSLKTLVDEVIVELRGEMAGRDIEWQIGSLPTLECDPGLMKQVFTNLLSNAIKYTRPRPKATIEVNGMMKDGQSVIYVRDNGVGFNMKYVNKLFGVFERLHRADQFEGTGIGLAIVRRIMQKHGGTVWAESEEDKGATFYLTLGGW